MRKLLAHAKPVSLLFFHCNQREEMWITKHSATEVATMLKTFSQILILCALLSVVTVVVLLFYYNSSHLIYLPQADFLGNSTNSFANIIQTHLDKLLEKQSYVLNAGQQAEEPAPLDTLEPCPDRPPNLIGPFSVDFSHSYNWDKVRRKISTPLHDGGRHKPSDCVSKHKVRKDLS